MFEDRGSVESRRPFFYIRKLESVKNKQTEPSYYICAIFNRLRPQTALKRTIQRKNI